MNLLKPLVASMLIAGLVGGPAIAAEATSASTANAEAVLHTNQAGYFQVSRAWLDRHSNAHIAGAKKSGSWVDRITLSGMANVDAAWGNRAPTTYSDHSASDVYLRNANLFVDAEISDWTKAHIAFAYEDGNNRFNRMPRASSLSADSVLDAAYVVIGNFSKSPAYARIGRQYVGFGDYQRYRIADTLPQLLTQTRATAATVGFVMANGFNGSAYIFQGSPQAQDDENFKRLRNFGLNIGFAQTQNNFCYKLGASYIRNMNDVDFINRGLDRTGVGRERGYHTQVGGASVDASVTANAFDFAAHYVTALQTFDINDATYTQNDGTEVGAKPSAWGVDAGYSFQTMGHSSRLGVGYQGARQASNLGPAAQFGDEAQVGLPRTRYLVNYTVNVSRNTDVGFEVYNDRDYGTRNEGTGRNALVGVARVAVRFN